MNLKKGITSSCEQLNVLCYRNKKQKLFLNKININRECFDQYVWTGAHKNTISR